MRCPGPESASPRLLLLLLALVTVAGRETRGAAQDTAPYLQEDIVPRQLRREANEFTYKEEWMKKEAQRMNAQREASQAAGLQAPAAAAPPQRPPPQLRQEAAGGSEGERERERERRDHRVHAAKVEQALQEAKRKGDISASISAQDPKFLKFTGERTDPNSSLPDFGRMVDKKDAPRMPSPRKSAVIPPVSGTAKAAAKGALAMKEALLHEALLRRGKVSDVKIKDAPLFRPPYTARKPSPRPPKQGSAAQSLQRKAQKGVDISNYTLSDEDRQKLKAIAIVFPQFHPIPENDQFWGEGFTEWTMLRPVPPVVNGVTTRRPHEDVGYYNFLNISHRRYMRALADHFGVYGFCFYHYWFGDHPVMHRPVQQMMIDGEPNKPFFLTWANEPWSKRWDGSNDQVLLAQKYSNAAGNKAHFEYLLPIFRHRNYMRINGMPVFAFYRIQPEDVSSIETILALWEQLAAEAGLPGIYFLQFTGSRHATPPEAVRARIEFEPLFSWVRTHHGPTIFQDKPYNAITFAKHNPGFVKELLKRKMTIEQFREEFPRDFEFLSSQFSVYDKHSTWDMIESRDLTEHRAMYRGSYCHWSNVPRRNFTNGDFRHYPHMMIPDSLSGCRQHLENMAKVISADPAGLPEKLLFLTAWNEWNEQSVFEPTDVEGYDALSAVKAVFRAKTGMQIVHVGRPEGEVDLHIHDLEALFDHYNHVSVTSLPLPEAGNTTALVHVHSVLLGDKPAIEAVIEAAERYIAMKVPVYVTVHDYHLLYPLNAYPPLDSMRALSVGAASAKAAVQLLGLADRVIFPTASLKAFYVRALGDRLPPPVAASFEVVPYSDMLEKPDRVSVPSVNGSVMNVAFVGPFEKRKGSEVFSALRTSVLRQYAPSKNGGGDFMKGLQFRFHVFGSGRHNDSCGAHCAPVHAEEAVAASLKGQKIHYHRVLNTHSVVKENIHILLYLSQIAEPYCMELAPGINTGLPIVYTNAGALKERLGALQRPGLFPVDKGGDVEGALTKAAEYVLSNQNTTENFYHLSSNIQPRKWYIENYPISSSVASVKRTNNFNESLLSG